jgi:hypothetical protein
MTAPLQTLLPPPPAPTLWTKTITQFSQREFFPPPHKMVENKAKTIVALERSLCLLMEAEMEFLDINLTKDSSLLLHSIHSPSTGGF